MEKDINPPISILMPVWNGEKYLAKAIESMLSQTFADFEFLIMDDGSKDRSLEIIRGYSDPRIRLIINDHNIGLIGTLNKGLAAARGKYVARMDQDDISFPERLAVQYKYMEAHPDITLCGTWSQIMNGEGKFLKIHTNPLRNEVIKYELMFGNTITHPSIMMKRDIIIQEGSYKEEWKNTEDYNLYSRLVHKYKLVNIPKPLIYYRAHGESITGTNSSQEIVRSNTYRMMRENISHYLTLSDAEFELIPFVLTSRIPNPKLKISRVFEALRLYKKLHRAFLEKEKENMDEEDRREIEHYFTTRKRLMFKKYLVGKYHLVSGKGASAQLK